MVSSLGDNLIFIISQPRAGSTLLQRILGSHPDIYTVSEPWLMLHPLYAMRPEGYEAEYGQEWAQVALRGFVKALPGGEDKYLEGVRRMYNYLYEEALASSRKRYFLDKTPRYYFIISSLYRTFPKAQYIILLRNPIAVLCSVLNTWVRDNQFWMFRLCRFRHDLTRAPKLLLEGMKVLGKRGVIVHYERLVRYPEREVHRTCDRLGLNFLREMVDYGRHNIPNWFSGDQDAIYQYERPSPENAEKWIHALDDPQVWRLANDYLQLLGQETLEQMGYSYEEVLQILQAHRPHRIRIWSTFSLAYLFDKPLEDRKKWERGVMRLARWLQQDTILRRSVCCDTKGIQEKSG
jgi:hypothetical protein